MKQYPHELSGGMRQRVMIVSCNPGNLIADEPTTALDVTIQAQTLMLMNELKRDFNTAIILITASIVISTSFGMLADSSSSYSMINGWSKRTAS